MAIISIIDDFDYRRLFLFHFHTPLFHVADGRRDDAD